MPGDRLLRFVRRWFDKGTVAIVFEPLVADWQREYQAALGWRRGACLVRGYAALVQSIGIIGSRAVAREALTPIGRDLAWQSARTAAGIVVFIGVVFTAFIRVASGEYPPAFGILVVSTPAILLMWLRNIWAREYGSLRARILDFLKLTALLGVVVGTRSYPGNSLSFCRRSPPWCSERTWRGSTFPPDAQRRSRLPFHRWRSAA